MKIVYMICFLSLTLFPTLLYADEIGSLSLFVFQDGMPLGGVEVIIEGKKTYMTDADGSTKTTMPAGKYKVEIFGKNKYGQNLGYFKKNVEIKSGKDTLVIATFTGTDEDQIIIDTPFEGKSKKIVKSDEKGWLNGIVLSGETNKPIANARIFVKGTSVDGRTKEDGSFSLEVPTNIALSVSIVHFEYSSQTLQNIYVKKDEKLMKEIKLSPAGVELEEFVVLAPKIMESFTSIVKEEKQSVSISNILSAEEMGKKGDSSAAGAIKRVTGVTLVDGNNVYVRGLGGRYSNIEMNSMPLPSTDPLKRTVPLDIFPAKAISSMKVQKSSSADIRSSFGGGYIDIRTKDTTNESYIIFSADVSGNSNTGKNVNSYKGSNTDILGFDNGYREINSYILSNSRVVPGETITALTTDNFTKEELSQLTKDYVNRNYDVKKKKQPIGFNLGVEAAKNIKVLETHDFSFYGFYNYKADSTSHDENYNRYDMQKKTGKLYSTPSQSGTIHNATNEYIHNVMLNLGYIYMDVLKVKYTKLYTRNADKTTLVADGVMGSNDENMTKYYLNWEERTLDVDQISGTFDYGLYGNDSKITYGLEHAFAKLYQPNNYLYTFRNENTPFLDNKISNNIAKQLESKDDLIAFYINNKFNFELLSKEDYLDIGLSKNSKDRKSRQNKYFLKKQGGSTIVYDNEMTGSIENIYDTYVRPDIDYDNRSLVVNQLFKPADHYDAEVNESDVYLNTFFKPVNNIGLLVGARYVNLSQIVYQYVEDRNNPDMSKRRLIVRVPEELTVSDIYPSLNLKYNYDDKNIFDISLSKTYIVPDLREFTSGEYFHPYEVATIVGNPDLKNTNIFNFDIKYGHYFANAQSIKFGLFFKSLDKPIEDVMVPSSSLPVYSYGNADKATLYGLEIDGRKDLVFISENLTNFYIAGNLSLTHSEVTLNSDQKNTYSTNHRQLQGLSPYVFNFTLEYDIKGRSLTLSYNKMGKRIRKVGMIDDGNSYPDNYEDPAATLDFVWKEKFTNGLTYTVKLGNMLQDEAVWTQGGNVTKSFKKPFTISMGISKEL